MADNRFLKKLIFAFVILLTLILCVVVICDPFYHYHRPVFGMKAVLTEPEYQVIGSIRNFDYDGILLGSSVAENFDNSWFQDGFDCKIVKGIRKSGTTAYLLYFLDEAYKNHELKYVFYSLDTSALLAEYKLDIEGDGLPVYLYDNNPFNDVSYIFNKDVIFEKIPYMFGQSLSNDYNENESYNWAKYKQFSAEIAMSNYVRPESHELSADEIKVYSSNIDENINELVKRVQAHPETEFYFWIPPYSSLWREQATLLGEMELSTDAIEKAFSALGKYENVHIMSFINNAEITDNLDNYMDPVHYSQDINYWIYTKILENVNT